MDQTTNAQPAYVSKQPMTFGTILLSCVDWIFPLKPKIPALTGLTLVPETKTIMVPFVHNVSMMIHYGVSLFFPAWRLFLDCSSIVTGFTSFWNSFHRLFPYVLCKEAAKNEELILRSPCHTLLNEYEAYSRDTRGLNVNRFLEFLNGCGLWVPDVLKWFGHAVPVHCLNKMYGILMVYNAGAAVNLARKVQYETVLIAPRN